MFVWNKQGNLIWKGIVPTKVKKEILVLPDERKVYFSGIEIPEGFKPTTSLDNPSENSKSFFSTNWVLILLIVLVLLVILFLFFC